MASQLEQYVARFRTALGADDEDHALFGKVRLGRMHLHRNTDAPRIVVYRDQGTIYTPDKAGYEKISISEDSDVRAKILATRKLRVSTYVHGRTDEETEDLVHNAIAAWRGLLHNDFRFGAEAWNPGPDNDRRGEECIFDIEIWFRVYDVQLPLTIVTGFTDEDLWGEESEVVDCRPPDGESSSSES